MLRSFPLGFSLIGCWLLGCHVPHRAAAPPAATAASALPATDWRKMAPITPQGYVCCRARSHITIDGRGDDPAWADAPWTHDFVDIEGPATRPSPRFRTRAKMLWDDQ